MNEPEPHHQLLEQYDDFQRFEADAITAIEDLRQANMQLIRLAYVAAARRWVDSLAQLAGMSRATIINWAVAYHTFGDDMAPDIPTYIYVHVANLAGGDPQKARQMLDEILNSEMTIAELVERYGSRQPHFTGTGPAVLGEGFFGIQSPPPPWLRAGDRIRVSARRLEDG